MRRVRARGLATPTPTPNQPLTSVSASESPDLALASDAPASCPCLAELTASDSAEWAGGCVEGFSEAADYDFYEALGPQRVPPTCDRQIPPDGPG